MPTAVNFYNNISVLRENGICTDEQLGNALIKGFITVEQYVELIKDETKALEGVKTAQILKSKALLESFLANNPYVDATNNKTYSVTFEKQSLLANAIATYQLSVAAGVPKTLKWNTTGDECVEFTFEEITALALSIAAYVEPMVSYQQSKEVAIRNATTIEEALGITVDYNEAVTKPAK